MCGHDDYDGCDHEVECCNSELDHAYECDATSGLCWDCGKPIPQTHEMRKCNQKCPNPDCALPFCPKVRGGECSTMSKVTLSRDSKILNANDVPYRGRILGILVDTQAAYRKRQGGRVARQAYESSLQ